MRTGLSPRDEGSSRRRSGATKHAWSGYRGVRSITVMADCGLEAAMVLLVGDPHSAAVTGRVER